MALCVGLNVLLNPIPLREPLPYSFVLCCRVYLKHEVLNLGKLYFTLFERTLNYFGWFPGYFSFTSHFVFKAFKAKADCFSPVCFNPKSFFTKFGTLRHKSTLETSKVKTIFNIMLVQMASQCKECPVTCYTSFAACCLSDLPSDIVKI